MTKYYKHTKCRTVHLDPPTNARHRQLPTFQKI